MILQTGMRTDIPAFYTPWFLKRLDEGFVLVRNPYNPSSVTKYDLSPDVVDLIGFCSKDPAPMLPHMDRLRPYGQYWFVTITPYGRDIEPNVPPVDRVLETFRRLSDAVGPDRIGWRYDPILITREYPVSYHLEAFSRMAQTLSGYTKTAVISFVDIYAKVARNFPAARPVSREDRLILGKAFCEIGRHCGMTIRPCAEGDELAQFGADCSGCMTVSTYETALGRTLRVPPRKNNQRNGQCACLLGTDIGAYDSCMHLCRYCYANTDPSAVRRNHANHDLDSPFLIGHSLPGDVIHEAKQESWVDLQMTLAL